MIKSTFMNSTAQSGNRHGLNTPGSDIHLQSPGKALRQCYHSKKTFHGQYLGKQTQDQTVLLLLLASNPINPNVLGSVAFHILLGPCKEFKGKY